MSAQISGTAADYVGIINGIMYRIDCSANASSQGGFKLAPLEAQIAPMTNWVASGGLAQTPAPDVTDTLPAPPAALRLVPDRFVEQARVEKAASAAMLFKRDGSEALRAGHPDLWALLVDGTCLSGSAFSFS